MVPAGHPVIGSRYRQVPEPEPDPPGARLRLLCWRVPAHRGAADGRSAPQAAAVSRGPRSRRRPWQPPPHLCRLFISSRSAVSRVGPFVTRRCLVVWKWKKRSGQIEHEGFSSRKNRVRLRKFWKGTRFEKIRCCAKQFNLQVWEIKLLQSILYGYC